MTIAYEATPAAIQLGTDFIIQERQGEKITFWYKWTNQISSIDEDITVAIWHVAYKTRS